MKRALVAIAVVAAALSGCDGQIVEPPANGAEGGGPGGDGPAVGDGSDDPARPSDRQLDCDPEAETADTTPARILTQRQYNNAIRDVFGADLPQLRQSTVAGGPFDNAVAGESSSVIMPALRSTAEAVGEQVMARGLAPECGAGIEGRACAEQLAGELGRRLFRRPVTEADRAALVSLYDELRSDAGGAASHTEALQGMIAAMLQMPRFLYRIEGVGRGGGRVALDGYDMASRLSFFLWNTVPDRELLDAAEAGELDAAEGVRSEAQRMLDDPRARRAIAHLYEQILGLDRVPYLSKDPELYGDFDERIGELMREETLRFIEEVVFERDGTVADLFDAGFTMLNEELARFYGVEGVSGDEFRPVEMDPSRRSGMLTHGSFLAQYAKEARTNPVKRGVYIIRNVLCWSLPDPPANVPPLEEDVEPGSTVREQLEAHRQPGCASCHEMIDPIGLAFESFDTTGRFRTMDEGGNPVDTHSDLKTPSGETVPIDGPIDLSGYVAASEDTEVCTQQTLFANAFARLPEETADHCLLARLRGEGGVPIREMLVELAASDMFRHRINPSPEVCE